MSKCPAVARGGGGWALLELTDALVLGCEFPIPLLLSTASSYEGGTISFQDDSDGVLTSKLMNRSQLIIRAIAQGSSIGLYVVFCYDHSLFTNCALNELVLA